MRPLQIRNALEKVYRHPEKLTKDIGGKAGTSEFADAVIEEMEKAKARRTARNCRLDPSVLRIVLRASSEDLRFTAPFHIEIFIPPLTLAADGSKFARSGESGGWRSTTRRVGVVLFQLGGPDTLAAIEPFPL